MINLRVFEDRKNKKLNITAKNNWSYLKPTRQHEINKYANEINKTIIACRTEILATSFEALLMLFFTEIRTENLIPKRGAYTISFVRVLVMVEHVMLFYLLPETAFKIKMVYGVMRYVIDKVP